MRRKKGMLVENVLSLIIAVIGLALLFYGAVKLYSVYVGQEEEAAKGLLNVIEAKIDALEEGEYGRSTIREVREWFLTAWSKDEPSAPEKCLFDSCICICKFSSNDCQKEGFCKRIKYDNLFVGKFRNYKSDLINPDKFFENPGIYQTEEYTFHTNERYYLTKNINFEGEQLKEYFLGIKENKVYMIEWDYEGGLPSDERSTQPDMGEG